MINKDNWEHNNSTMLCKTCMYFVPKAKEGEVIEIGRCRKHAPTLDGWPAMFITDWCGDHKINKDKLPAKTPMYFTKPKDLVRDYKLGRTVYANI